MLGDVKFVFLHIFCFQFSVDDFSITKLCDILCVTTLIACNQ